MTPRTGTACACTNIALVKYWGKRDADANRPAAGSISLTLAGLVTRTTVTFDRPAGYDCLTLNGAPQTGESLARVSRFLDLVREAAGSRDGASVESANSFPTGSGLASSAAGFAALAVAAARAGDLGLEPTQLSALARRGSGSAARSIFGGFVELRAEGADPRALQLLSETEWDLRMIIAVVGGGSPKAVSSRSGMVHTAQTSPLYPGWLASVPSDLAVARAAILDRDLATLGEVAERSALTMHASAMAARPGLIYFQPTTLALMQAVIELRRRGIAAWFTIDAGPHVKVLTTPEHAAKLAEVLGAVPGVTSVLTSRPGPGAV